MEFYSNKFRELRHRKGFSLKMIGDKLGIPKQSVNNWEKGRCNPRRNKIPKIANILGVSVVDICDEYIEDFKHEENVNDNDLNKFIVSFKLLNHKDKIEVLDIILGKLNKKLQNKNVSVNE